MSNIFELPYFQAVFADPDRREALAQRIADRLVKPLNTLGGHRQFRQRMQWFAGLCEAARRCDDAIPWSLVSQVARLTADEDVFSPSLEWHLASLDYVVSDRESSRLFHRWEFVEDDRSYAVDRLSEWGSFSGCECCGESSPIGDLADAYGGELVCESCRDDSYTWSEYHDAWVHCDSSRPAIDQDGSRCLIHQDADDFEYDEDREMYMHVDYIRERRVIQGYHSSKGAFEFRADDWCRQFNRYMGVELEVEGYSRDPEEAARAIHQSVNGGMFGRHVFFERDGSLSSGFEMITHPQSLPAHRELFTFLRDPALVRGLRSHRTTTCGLHVHVSRSGLSNLTIARAVTFVNDPGNDAFITAIARRYSTSFCKVVEKDVETAHLSADRYEAINLTGRDTIEFRIFRGSLKYEAVISAIEFSHAILEYCARAETGSSALNAHAFLAYCANHLEAETRVMRAYVADRTAGLFQHSEAA
jgi:hypothetical protein